MTAHGLTIADRFWAKVDTSAGPDACWPWLAGKTKAGYGLFKVGDRCVTAHSWAYQETHGPLLESTEVDHVRARGCTRRDCCNPAHLEAVTHIENCRRAQDHRRYVTPSGTSYPARTHCKRGHELTPENTKVMTSGGRACRICWTARKREAEQRRKEAA